MREEVLNTKSTLLEAIEAIEASPRRMTVVVSDEGKLLGTLTDGDVRRHLLAGGALEDISLMAMNHNPITALVGASPNVLKDLMRIHNVVAIPVIDKDGLYSNVVHLTDLMARGTSNKNIENICNSAVIMAGGEGNRLRPLTEKIPKPMIKIGTIPLLEYQIKTLSEAGFKRVYLSINYLGHVIENYFGNGEKFGIELIDLNEELKLGTAGSLALLPEIPSQPFLVINGDIYTKSNFASLLSLHIEDTNSITIGAIDYSLDIPYGMIEINGTQVTGILEKPTQHFFCNAGIYAVSPELIKLIPTRTLFNMTDLINSCLNNGFKVGAFPIYEYWTDIGTPEDLEKARKVFAENEAPANE